MREDKDKFREDKEKLSRDEADLAAKKPEYGAGDMYGSFRRYKNYQIAMQRSRDTYDDYLAKVMQKGAKNGARFVDSEGVSHALDMNDLNAGTGFLNRLSNTTIRDISKMSPDRITELFSRTAQLKASGYADILLGDTVNGNFMTFGKDTYDAMSKYN